MYHAVGYSSILVMQAGMTFETKDIDAAMTSLKESQETCQRCGEIVQCLDTSQFFGQPLILLKKCYCDSMLYCVP